MSISIRGVDPKARIVNTSNKESNVEGLECSLWELRIESLVQLSELKQVLQRR